MRTSASVLAAAVRLGVPVTAHVGIGYDIVHEHPNFDAAACGTASYQDFLSLCHTVDHLEGGVFLCYGSAVMGPEVYLKALSIRHIYCSPHHPQTNGKLERFHETLKRRLNLLVYTSPGALRRAMGDFIEFYNHRRYHEGIGNVAPADVYYDRRDQILEQRRALKRATIVERCRYNLGQTIGGPRVGV